MSFTRRKFVLGMGTVIFFTGSASSLLANTRQEKEVRYAMIHDESRCNGCNICARACRKTNHVPAQGSRLSIAHIPVIDNDNGTQYHFFRQSCQHCEDAPCIDVCPTGASWRDEQGIVRVEKSQCIGCSYCIGVCPYQVRYLNPVTKVADKCDFCAETRLAKGFPPICVSEPVGELCATVHPPILAGVVDHCRTIAGWDVVGAGATCLASCSWREEISHRS